VSFRIRVVLLVSLAALGAAAATAAFTVRQAGNQVREAVSASQETTDLLRDRLRDHAWRHGTWAGVDEVVRRLHQQTGQRIRLVDELDDVIVDSDHQNGRAARPPGATSVYLDPRPTLLLRPDDPDPRRTTLAAIHAYRADLVQAVCLSRGGYDLAVTTGPDGLPRHVEISPPDAAAGSDCGSEADWLPELRADDAVEVGRCRPARRDLLVACLQRVFTQQIAVGDIAPVPLLLTVGAAGEPFPALDAGPFALAALVVAVLVAGAALLISGRVLRPIGTLTAAARRLGDGDRSGRVPESGRDELADLARAFNRMADSVRAAEDNQRRLIADVAHELRTPLANLRGYLEALEDGVLEPTPELFASLHEEAILYQRIVGDLQELALAEAGALVYHRAPGDLVELLETARTAHAAAAGAAGVGLVVEADGPVVAEVDADRIRQAVGNLVANALRATPAGGSVTLSAHTAGDRALLRVADTGAGIAAEHLPLVFDRFWRADPARGRDTGGSGLGLAIVRQIVRDHRGEVSVRSEPGAGATFEISLPRVP
jgi:two-component system sensor histidine kinase BaeS